MSLLDGLISYIRFNRIDGNTIPAEIGTDGVATDIVIEDGSAKFNGLTSGVSLFEPRIKTQKTLTIAFWIKYDKSKATGNFHSQAIFNLSDNHTRNVYIDINGEKNNNGEKIEFVNYDVGSKWNVVRDNIKRLNKWVHILFTVESNKLRCFINSELLQEKNINYSPGSDVILFGVRDNSAYLNGNIKEFRFYNRALTDDEITELYNYVPSSKPKNQLLTISQTVLANQPTSTNQVLTISQIVQAPIDLTKNRLLTIEQRVVASFNKQLLTIEQAVENRQQIRLKIEQNVVSKLNNQLLTIEQLVVKSQATTASNYKFSGGKGKTFGFGDFNLYVYINKRQVDACALIDTITISRGERESALCEILLLQNRGKVDFYAFHGKEIRIDTVHSDGVTRCYTGLIDEPTFRPFDRRAILKCSDLRLKRNENLEQSYIDRIGFYSKEVFKDITDDKAAELERRLESIPYSFEYDPSGTPHLTSWKPKEVPDFVINDCSIYKREPLLTISPMGRVVNRVKIKFNNNYTRLLQRDLPYKFDSKPYTICDYLINNFIMCPKVADIETATQQTGWLVGEMKSDPLPKSGWYFCKGQNRHWSVTNTTIGGTQAKKDKDGNAIKDKDGKEIYNATGVTIEDNSKVYAPKANWLASKRWAQNVSEQFEYTVDNTGSIARYGEQETEISYQIEHEFEDKDGFLDYKEYAKPKGFKKSGDYFKDYSDVNKSYQETWGYALNVAKTKIYASHRQNSIVLEIPFAPQFDLKHTLGLVSRNFKGKAKVSRIAHKIDVIKKRAETTVTCKFYQGFDGDEVLILPARPTVETAVSGFETKTLKTHLLKSDEDGEDIEGYVVKEFVTMSTMKGETILKKLIPVHFLVKVSEIEKKSTDALIKKAENSVSINIPNDNVELWI